MSVAEELDRFMNQKRRVMTEDEFNAKWGGHGGRQFCTLCNHTFQVGEGWRWVYANGPKPEGQHSFGNFSVCDSCDGPDVLERYQAACSLFYETMKGRGEGHWPVNVAAKLIALLAVARQQHLALCDTIDNALVPECADKRCPFCDKRRAALAAYTALGLEDAQ